MTRTDKLFAGMLASNRRSISFREFERLLVAFGFVLDRQRGSHRQYVHPVVPRPFPVQPTSGDAKRYQVREFLDMVEQYGLKMDE